MNQPFYYQDRQLMAEQVAVAEIAKQFGTPFYLYAKNTIVEQWQRFQQAYQPLNHRICFAVKANSNLAVLQTLVKLGSSFDIVSIGEMERVIAAGGSGDLCVFSGVGKTRHEIRRALQANIRCFNVESAFELNHINQIAGELNCTAPIALRINPNVSAKTHPYIATGLGKHKFGIALEQTRPLCQQIKQFSHLKLTGIDCHIGSQITELAPLRQAFESLITLADELMADGFALDHLDLGGGFGIQYQADEQALSIEQHAAMVKERLGNRSLAIYLEPGRAIVGKAGILVTEVIGLKQNGSSHFAVVDAGMNDLIRSALYQAWHDIWPVRQSNGLAQTYDVVGPVCETSDTLGFDRQLAITEGDLLAIMDSGAYGFTLSSNYNSRPRIPEIMVDGSRVHLIRQRETHAQLWQGEQLLP